MIVHQHSYGRKGMWVVTDMISSALVYDFSVPNDSERNMSRSGPI